MEEAAVMYDLVEMRKELTTLEAKFLALRDLVAAAEAYEDRVGKKVAVSNNVQVHIKPRKPVKPLGVMESTEAIVGNLMQAKNAPQQTADIIKHMRDIGYRLPEKNPTNVISARLSNSKKFVGRRGLGWWYAHKPWPGETEMANLLTEIEPHSGTDPTGGPIGEGGNLHHVAQPTS